MEVILVDENDKETGIEDKIKAHKEGKLHRAFSIFVFNSENELLLQKRASTKYHSADLWSNTCCSHPRPGKMLQTEAMKRLKEEMGISCELKEMFSFIYKAKVSNDMTENEYDHVFIGFSDMKPKPNVKEVQDWKHVSYSELEEDIQKNPEKYTVWLKKSYKKVQELLDSM